MKALVLSGGSGTRLRPFTHSMPKQLIPIANRPILQHVLENIADLGVTEVGIIVGDWEQQITETLGDGSALGVHLTYIPQDSPRGLAHAVVIARDFLGDDDFVMYLGDNVLPGGVAQIAEEFGKARPAAQVVVHKVTDPRSFGVVELGPAGQVVRLVEKPAEPRSDLALIGVYFFTSAIHEAVNAIEPSARGELEITDAIQWLVTHGDEVRAGEYDGYWKDAGCVEDVLDCNRQLLDGMRGSIAGEVDGTSVLSGQVVVEPGARVVRSWIEGPVVIAAGTVVEDAHLGPYTSIGRDCLLRDTHIDDSIVFNGATVSSIGRLKGSMIGRAALVVSTGDHSRAAAKV
ncbi:glucose-1-phosphate thymidylyltransferase [Streptomyces sp. RKAG290]|uniref:glucose-1-phosphate thymidylyltransferase n=1 Tax=Streptomyces sp. RKAG290 TaxID=2888348 RepID=UPI0020332C82|nr:glucose-1-phosphate thymidylyltransferase [Streptomyces sp. RKAG290]MCM2414284.1 glucose-1-phosphate thymidylyltransferase [Streptomyces sp. RKAG290]